MPTRIATAAALMLSIPAMAMAEPGRMLTVGDPAPPIAVGHWLKGEAVESFQPGKIYVLEFWATWCAPCRASMPHLGDTQQQYKDYGVTVIGVSDEKLQKVVAFLCKADSESVTWSDKIHYTLATDPDKSVYNDYMRPAARDKIPSAFIIGKDSRIEWIGYAMDMDDALARVVRDDWDRQAAREEYESLVAPVRASMKVGDEMEAAVERGDWAGAIAATNQLDKSNDQHAALQVKLFRKMLHRSDDAGLTYQFGREVMQANWDSPGILNSLAWYTVDDEQVEHRDLDFALEAAGRAVELADQKNASILDTLARVHYEAGDVKAAVKFQREAVEHAGDSPIGSELRETLIKYEKAAAGR